MKNVEFLQQEHPKRPNPIGLSVVHVDKIEGTILYISNVDIIDGTPLLDISRIFHILINVKMEDKNRLV